MDYKQNICFTCLKDLDESNLENFVDLNNKDDNNISYYDKLVWVIPEIGNEDIEDTRVCSKCEGSIQDMYEFKMMCTKNRARIIDGNGESRKRDGNIKNEDETIDNTCSIENDASWKLNKLTEALLAIESSEVKNIKDVSKKYNVPELALARRMRGEYKKKPYALTISYEHHKNLNIHLIKVSRNYKTDLKRFFYNYIQRNDIFNDYFKSILTNNRNVLNRNDSTDQFYDHVHNMIVKHKVDPSNVFSINKFTISYENLRNRQRSLQNETVTSFISGNCLGETIPLVSTQKIGRNTQFMYANNTEMFYSQNDDLILVRYLEILKYYTNTTSKSILLVESKFLTFPFYDFCRNNNIIAICIPSIVQPIGLKLINRIKYKFGLHYTEQNVQLTTVKFVELLNRICDEVLTKGKIVESFRSTGIHPLNKNSVDIDFHDSISCNYNK